MFIWLKYLFNDYNYYSQHLFDNESFFTEQVANLVLLDSELWNRKQVYFH